MSSPVARRAVALFLPVAIAATLLAGLGYGLVQYDLRSGANEPQEQLAEDAAAALEAGRAPSELVAATAGADRVDVARSLAPFLVVYDAAGKVLATDGQLDGGDPIPPAGVLATARQAGRDVVTWQPRAGVRIAVVAVGWSGGSVLAGRSLRLVEIREDQALRLTVLAWGATLLAVAAAAFVAARLWPGRSGQRAESPPDD